MFTAKDLLDSLSQIIIERNINNNVLNDFITKQSDSMMKSSGFNSLPYFNYALKKLQPNIVKSNEHNQNDKFILNVLNYLDRLSDQGQSQSKQVFLLVPAESFTGNDEEIIKLNAFLFKILKLSSPTIKGPKISEFLKFYENDKFNPVCKNLFQLYIDLIKESIHLNEDLEITDINNKNKTKKELVAIIVSALLFQILQICEDKKILVPYLFTDPNSQNIQLVCNRILNGEKTYYFDLSNCAAITDNDENYQKILNIVGVGKQ